MEIIGPARTEKSVEAICWDITMGAAGTSLGQMFLRALSSSEQNVPEAVDHVGIVVYGHLYEYGDIGIIKTQVKLGSQPESVYPVSKLRSGENVGETTKTQREFDEWVAKLNKDTFQQDDFRFNLKGSKYDVVTKSCIVWATEACKFLGVRHPPNWDKIRDWASENKTLAGLVGSSGLSSRSGVRMKNS